jgi:hypothetical protein
MKYGVIIAHIEPDLFAYYDNYAGGFEKYLENILTRP